MNAQDEFEAYIDKLIDDHAGEVAACLHDDKCEWRDAGFFMCDCFNRRRIANNLPVRLPDLDIRCPHCHSVIKLDIESGYTCSKCRAWWHIDGTFRQLIDDPRYFEKWLVSDEYGSLTKALEIWEKNGGSFQLTHAH